MIKIITMLQCCYTTAIAAATTNINNGINNCNKSNGNNDKSKATTKIRKNKEW